MAKYIVYGMAVFTNAQRRNRVVTQAQTLATNGGFAPSSRVPDYPPGTTSFNYTATETGDGMTKGNTYPAARICYEHTDQQAVADAELLIQDEMNSQGWLYGQVGTWTDVSG